MNGRIVRRLCGGDKYIQDPQVNFTFLTVFGGLWFTTFVKELKGTLEVF